MLRETGNPHNALGTVWHIKHLIFFHEDLNSIEYCKKYILYKQKCIYTVYIDISVLKKIRSAVKLSVSGQSVTCHLSVRSSIGSCEQLSLFISCSSCSWFWPAWSLFLKTITAAPFPTILPALSTPCYTTPTVLPPHESLIKRAAKHLTFVQPIF